MSSENNSMAFKKTPLYLYSKPDLTIAVGDSDIEVHEYVLASQSEFFKAALRSGLEESQKRRITLPEIQPNIMLIVLNWLYRAPPTSHYSIHASHTQDEFSSESAQALKDILQAFDFLQINGAERDYCKLVEESLQKIGTHDRLQINGSDAKSIVIQLNEVYKAKGSISKKALGRLVNGIYAERRSFAVPNDFMSASEQLPDPNGRCFRDISLAFARSKCGYS
ncbi:uncharacterized protein DFL_004648 [Arthrobotrys flagrans]|uniref:BTB domain-containing protein n=1 Tax=Arthrobotrys flagrans TaxID=97331 RepID=A0A437A5C9_ARTFL|nr:hypothetical protein DFL_004648 [Arthrobotrys flagrans]